MGGKGKMKDRLYFEVDEASEIFPPEGFEHFYLSPELTSGGFQLRNGSKGGFITFNGHGYSYETFICFLKKNKK